MNQLGDFLHNSRKDYNLNQLDENSILPNPVLQFGKWMEEAIQAGVNEPNAMNLATVSDQGKPSSRIVLLRSFDENGFVFYTNFNSRKGTDLSNNSHAALNFFWPELHRQVRIEGTISKVDPATSDHYFKSRPRESQIGAWVSDQSGVLKSRQHLDDSLADFISEFEGKSIERPPHWGGYRLSPEMMEFWQGRTSRLHDRLEFRLDKENWVLRRLYP